MNARRKLTAAAALSALAVACNVERESVGPTLSVFDLQSEGSSAPLVQHLVAPQATDPAIDQFLADHYVWLDTAAHPDHKLFVLMPGTGQIPAAFQFVEREAARLGYAVIGLSYLNSGGFAKVCPLAIDPAACYEDSRLEIIDGIDRSPYVNVSPANSIDNRLTKLLQYLAATYPDEGWSQFLQNDGPNWPLIAVSGLSQGGGEAAMIARLRLVDRVVLFSSVTDSLGRESVPWVGEPHVTPSNRYWGLANDRDAFYPAIVAGWDSLGLAPLGPATFVETSAPPYGWTHMLVTDLTPQGGFVGLNAHASPATDAFTPVALDGTPLLREAWRYLLGALPRRPGVGEQVAEGEGGGGTR